MNSQDTTGKPIRISIILPVYNVADFLPECLQSIVDQSFDHEIEALLVDDCSTDNSKAICIRYADEYPGLFKLISHETNRGVSVARNSGLDIARGDYFLFVDADDVLAAGALQALYSAATEFDADIVKGNNTIFNDNGEQDARYNVASDSMITGDDILTVLYTHDKVRGHPWGKLFNRTRLGRARFPVGVRFSEDLLYCSQVFSEASSLRLIAKQVYRYRHRDASNTERKFETGDYLVWMESIENIGVYARNAKQARALRGLQLRTLAQLSRECLGLEPVDAAAALSVIEQRCEQWNIRLPSLLRAKLPLRDLARYIKLQQALKKVRRNLAQSR
jgi:glycosyltransferase involved in cell wall biosynthesis